MRNFKLTLPACLVLSALLGMGAMLATYAKTLPYARPHGSSAASAAQDQSQCCFIAVDVLKASAAIRPGMTRGEVELHFRQDGGTQVRDMTRYVFRDCDYIMVDIHFNLAAPTDRAALSPNDLVKRVSKPYLAYPRID